MTQQKKQKTAKTFTEEQVRNAVAEALACTAKELNDPSLVIAGLLAMSILDKKLK